MLQKIISAGCGTLIFIELKNYHKLLRGMMLWALIWKSGQVSGIHCLKTDYLPSIIHGRSYHEVLEALCLLAFQKLAS